jgi:hypothetical protein
MTEVAGVGAGAEILAGDQAPHRRIERADQRHDCANCGTHLTGAYCHNCGQKGHLHTRIWHMAEDFIEGVMHFDGRLWRTLPLLALRPGRLSRAWIEGKRVRYVAPLHIFLFSIFLFFLALSLSGGEIFSGIFEGIAKSGGEAPAVRVATPSQDGAAAPPPADGQVRVSRDTGAEVTIAGDPVDLDDCLVKGSKSYGDWKCEALRHIRENPKYYAYKAETLTYKLAPLLAPVSILILAVLLVFKRGYTLYDHGVVSLYGLSFLALLVTLAIILNSIIPGDWGLFVMLAVIVHAVVHLRGAYKLSWFGSVVRTLLLGLATSTVFSLFLFGVAAMSAA